MSSKWDKLNKALDEALENLTQDDWIKWDKNRAAFREQKKVAILISSLEQERKINLSQEFPLVRSKYDFFY